MRGSVKREDRSAGGTKPPLWRGATIPAERPLPKPLMQIFDAAATRTPLDFDRLVPALRTAFAAEASVPPRHVHTVRAGADQGTVLIMPAWSEAGLLGIKTVNIFPGNGARGLPGLHASYVLYDARTGVPLALMDGNEITARRTA